MVGAVLLLLVDVGCSLRRWYRRTGTGGREQEGADNGEIGRHHD